MGAPQRHTCLPHLAGQCDGPWVPGPGPGVRLSALEARQEGRVPEGWGLKPWLLGPLCGVSRHPDGQPSEVTAKDEAKEPGKEWDLATIRGQSSTDHIWDVFAEKL